MEAFKLRKSEIRTMFRVAYNGRANMLTPRALEYGQTETLLYEISEGEGLLGSRTIYGITFITRALERKPELSKGGFDSLESVYNYLESVKHMEREALSTP